MSFESDETVVAGTGHIWTAAVGTAFPTNISTAISEDLWAELGYTTEAGVTFTFDRTSKGIKPWQSQNDIRTIVTGEPKNVEFTLMQWNQNTFQLANNGGTWTEPTSGKYLYTPPTAGTLFYRAVIVQFTDDTKNYRFCFYKALNEAPLKFATVPDDTSNLPINLSILQSDTTTNPYIFQTDDANLGLAASAGS